MTAGERELRYRCRHCAMVFLVGRRLPDEALRMLRDHVRLVHPRIGLSADAQAGAILSHFDVESVQ